MERSVNKLFKDIKESPATTLSENIWEIVRARELRAYRIKSLSYGFLGALSIVSLVVAVKDLVVKFAQSGFYEYMSLAFSESGSISIYWREFALSIADSLPVTSIVFSLLAILVLFISLKLGVRQFRNQLSIA